LGGLRDSKEYINKHYRAHWQPLCAIFGLFGCIMIVIFSGWPAIYLLSAGEAFLTENRLKPKDYLAADVVGAYSGVSEFFPVSFCLPMTKKLRR
jgi:amino acid transporter